jgi:hypothetical protein
MKTIHNISLLLLMITLLSCSSSTSIPLDPNIPGMPQKGDYIGEGLKFANPILEDDRIRIDYTNGLVIEYYTVFQTINKRIKSFDDKTTHEIVFTNTDLDQMTKEDITYLLGIIEKIQNNFYIPFTQLKLILNKLSVRPKSKALKIKE